jgi:acyl dehydratase
MSVGLRDAVANLEARVGESVEFPIPPIGALAAQRFAVASSDDNPVFFSESAALEAGYQSLAVPPLLLTSVREWGAGPALSGLRVDGTPLSDLGIPPVELRVLGGGQELHFYRDVTVGTPIRARFELCGVSLTEGKTGSMVVVQLKRTFTDTDGELLIACDERRILR